MRVLGRVSTLVTLGAALVLCADHNLWAQAVAPTVQQQIATATQQAGINTICPDPSTGIGRLSAIFPSSQTLNNSAVTMMAAANPMASISSLGSQANACGAMTMSNQGYGSTSPFGLNSAGQIAFLGTQATSQVADAYNNLSCNDDIPKFNSCSDLDKSLKPPLPKFSSDMDKLNAEKAAADKMVDDRLTCENHRDDNAKAAVSCFQRDYEAIGKAMNGFRSDIENARQCFDTSISTVKALQTNENTRATTVLNKGKQISAAIDTANKLEGDAQKAQSSFISTMASIRGDRNNLYNDVKSKTLGYLNDCMDGDPSYDTPLSHTNCVARSRTPTSPDFGTNNFTGSDNKFTRLDVSDCLVNTFFQASGGLSHQNADQNRAGDLASSFASRIQGAQIMIGSYAGSPNTSGTQSSVVDQTDLSSGVTDASGAIETQFQKSYGNLATQFGAAGQVYTVQFEACRTAATTKARNEYTGSSGLGQERMALEAKITQLGSDSESSAKSVNSFLLTTQSLLGTNLQQALGSNNCPTSLQDPPAVQTNMPNAMTDLENRQTCVSSLKTLLDETKDGTAAGGAALPVTTVPGLLAGTNAPECVGTMPGQTPQQSGQNGCQCTGLASCATVFQNVGNNIKVNADNMTGNGFYVDPNCATQPCPQIPGTAKIVTLGNAAITQAINNISGPSGFQGLAQTNSMMLSQLNAMLARIPGAARLANFDPTKTTSFKCDTKDDSGVCQMPDDFSSLIKSTSGLPLLNNDDFDKVTQSVEDARTKAKDDHEKSIDSVTTAFNECKDKSKTDVGSKISALKANLDVDTTNCVASNGQDMTQDFSAELSTINQICVTDKGGLFDQSDCTGFDTAVRQAKANCLQQVNNSPSKMMGALGAALGQQQGGRGTAAETGIAPASGGGPTIDGQ